MDNLVSIFNTLATILGTLFVFLATFTNYKVTSVERQLDILLEELSDKSELYVMNRDEYENNYNDRAYKLNILLEKYDYTWQELDKYYAELNLRKEYCQNIGLTCIGFLSCALFIALYNSCCWMNIFIFVLILIFNYGIYKCMQKFLNKFLGNTSIANYPKCNELIDPRVEIDIKRLNVLKNMPIKLFCALHYLEVTALNEHTWYSATYDQQENKKENHKSIVILHTNTKIVFSGKFDITSRDNQEFYCDIDTADIIFSWVESTAKYILSISTDNIKTIKMNIHADNEWNQTIVYCINKDKKYIPHYSGGNGPLTLENPGEKSWKEFILKNNI